MRRIQFFKKLRLYIFQSLSFILGCSFPSQALEVPVELFANRLTRYSDRRLPALQN